MANFNQQGAYWNRDVDNGGFIWNTDLKIKIKHIGENLSITDSDYNGTGSINLIVRLALSENNLSISDNLDLFAFYDGENLEDKFYFEQEEKVSLLFYVAEEIGITDEITDFIAMIYLNENVKLLEELKLFVELLSEESINIKDIVDIFAFYKLMEEFGLVDLKVALQAYFYLYEKFGLTDHDPRTAVSDFMIGAIDNDDRAYDWFIPFGLKVDWGTSNVQVMPEAELTTIEIPGVDGSVVEDTTYRDRIFNIVSYSGQGFTTFQKEELKKKINRILDATKHQTKKLTIQASSTSFDVKYSGQAQIEEGPSYIKTTIPLHAPPYGYDMFPYEFYGDGLVWNNGDTFLRPIHYIKGPVSNPGFQLGDKYYKYYGTVPSGSTLIINQETMTAYLEDAFGERKNAMKNFSGEWQAIPVDGSVVLTADRNTVNCIRTEWRNNVLW